MNLNGNSGIFLIIRRCWSVLTEWMMQPQTQAISKAIAFIRSGFGLILAQFIKLSKKKKKKAETIFMFTWTSSFLHN